MDWSSFQVDKNRGKEKKLMTMVSTKDKKTIAKIFLSGLHRVSWFLLGFFIMNLDLGFNWAKMGITRVGIPLLNYYKSLHFMWDLCVLLIFIDLCAIILLEESKKYWEKW